MGDCGFLVKCASGFMRCSSRTHRCQTSGFYHGSSFWHDPKGSKRSFKGLHPLKIPQKGHWLALPPLLPWHPARRRTLLRPPGLYGALRRVGCERRVYGASWAPHPTSGFIQTKSTGRKGKIPPDSRRIFRRLSLVRETIRAVGAQALRRRTIASSACGY